MSSGPIKSRPRHTGRVAPRVVDEALNHALAETWGKSIRARVSDAQLGGALSALFRQSLADNIFQGRHDAIRLVPGVGPDGVLDLFLSPGRRKVPHAARPHAPDGCAMCAPPVRAERGVAWRNFVIWPNLYPYFPASDEHLVIASRQHMGQQFDRALFRDLLRFQKLASGERPVTLHYNGTAGNSQFHFHWQSSKALFPLQKKLDDGALALSPLRSERAGDISQFEDRFFQGLVVRGNPRFVEEWATRIVTRLHDDPYCQGRYNLVLLQPSKDHPARLVIFPRKAQWITTDPRSRWAGAATLGGVLVGKGNEDAYDKNTLRRITRGMKDAHLPLAALSWLRPLCADGAEDVG